MNTVSVGTAYAGTMARYNQWMNQQLYELCATLSDADRKQDRGAFFNSIHGTLNHLLLADRLWLGRFLQRPFAISSLDQILYDDFETLRRERQQTDTEILQWAQGLSDEQLADTFTYTSVVGRQTRTYQLGFLVTHFFNHQTHHRGQLTTLLSQCGIDSGVTDLLWLPVGNPS